MKMRTLVSTVSLSAALAVVSLAACGADDVKETTPAAGGAAGSGGSSVGNNTTGGTGGAPEAPKSDEKLGSIQVYTEIDTDPRYPATYAVEASFVSVKREGLSADCAIEEKIDANCVLTKCPVAKEAVAVTDTAAGPLTIKSGTRQVLVTPIQTDYKLDGDDGALYVAGAPVQVSAPGKANEVPAFDQTAKAPGTLKLVSPALPPFPGEVTINRAQDFALSVSGGAPGSLLLVTATGSDPAAPVRLVCTYDVSTSGDVKIPAAALSRIPAGNDGRFTVEHVAQTKFKAGDYNLTLNVTGFLQDSADATDLVSGITSKAILQ